MRGRWLPNRLPSSRVRRRSLHGSGERADVLEVWYLRDPPQLPFRYGRRKAFDPDAGPTYGTSIAVVL